MKTMSSLIKSICVVMSILMAFCLTSCKSQNVKDCESAIKGIDEVVTINSYSQIQDARRLYNNLSSEEKEDVSNYEILVGCENAYKDAVKDKADEIRRMAHECASKLVAKEERAAISKAEDVVNELRGLPSYVISDSEFSDIDDIEYWDELYQVISGKKEDGGAYSYYMCSTVLEHALAYDV